MATFLACLYFWTSKYEVSQKIQLLIFIVLSANLVFFWIQLIIFKEDAEIRQRPFISLEVKANVIGEKIKLMDLDATDEIKIVLKFENKGLSPADIEYIDARVYYGYFSDIKKDAMPSFYC